jgi:DNA-binding LytR/AlgR family response regulator
MKLLAELRSLKKQVIELQNNQKEKEVKSEGTFTCSGSAPIVIDPIQKIGMLEMEIESLYMKLIDTQSKVIQYSENNY